MLNEYCEMVLEWCRHGDIDIEMVLGLNSWLDGIILQILMKVSMIGGAGGIN